MSWQKNEATAASRTTLLIITDDGGYPISPGSDPIASGAVFVVGVNAPDADLATGTCTNVRRPLVATDFTFTADASDVCTAVAHGKQTGDGPVRLLTSAADLPLNLLTGTDYWIIKLTDDTFGLATSLANAYAGTDVDIGDAGTGTHTVDVTGVGTERGVWGHFEFVTSQAQINHDRKFTEVFVDGLITKPAAEGGGSYSCLRMNGGGAHTQVEMVSASADLWGYIIDGGYSAEQILRGLARLAMAKRNVNPTTGVETTRDLADTKDAFEGTVAGTSRNTNIIDLD